MSATALGELDRVAIRVVKAHRALPWLLVRRLGKFDRPAFQLLIERPGIVVIMRDFPTPAGDAAR